MLGQHRSTQRRIPRGRDGEDRLVADMIALARRYGRYGYRRIAALLRDAGWQVNDKRVERLWRREGLKVPGKQPRRGRLWLNDGSCIRLRAERANHVWSYDFVHHRTDDGRAFRMLNVLDEFTRESLAIRVRRKLSSADVIDVLTELFILRGVPGYIRSDNGPEFVAEAVRQWITAVGERHHRGRLPGQHDFEMPPREAVLFLEEEGAGEFEPDPDEGGIGDQHLAEGGDRLVEQLVALVGLGPGRLGQGGHSLPEQRAHVLGGGGKGKQEDQGKAQSAHRRPTQ